MSFDSLGLGSELLRAITQMGYTQPTPIQNEAIPIILQGRDLMATAQTGTGKTASFTLPLLQRLGDPLPVGNKAIRPIRALILTPTRELAAQVEKSVATYGQHLPLRSSMICGGMSFHAQRLKLRRGIDILVATPGRLLDHIAQQSLDLRAVQIVVLDEADRMLDMGFIHDIRKILALMPEQRQTLMFSATLSLEVKKLADQFLRNPALLEVVAPTATVQQVQQMVHWVDRPRKRELLAHMIGSQNWQQVLVFTRTKHGANQLAEQLEEDGLKTAAIHGNKSQGARTRALESFRRGAVRVLVATDVAARGLDIAQLPYVVNFDLPDLPEDYVHRIGRTGRAGHSGQAISLVSREEKYLLRDIERLLKQDIPKGVIPGYEPLSATQPVKRKPQGSSSHGHRAKLSQPSSVRGADQIHSDPQHAINKPRSGKRSLRSSGSSIKPLGAIP
ncbi:MAG: DEAD/DEAH box helicase [Cyanobacteriota bacterium]|nr:DEAD/DEAH box helicase [Cyanobacteriota bacterium]